MASLRASIRTLCLWDTLCKLSTVFNFSRVIVRSVPCRGLHWSGLWPVGWVPTLIFKLPHHCAPADCAWLWLPSWVPTLTGRLPSRLYLVLASSPSTCLILWSSLDLPCSPCLDIVGWSTGSCLAGCVPTLGSIFPGKQLAFAAPRLL